MGTRFRTMLAPIGLSTGDGRRFADGSITLADVPFPFEWVRSREGGHDGAVGIGVIQQAKVMSVKDALAGGWVSEASAKKLDSGQMAVWGQGELFDDVSREDLPRLAEDVAEATHLISAGTLGPSVDLDTFSAVPVMKGSDDPVTWEQIEQYMDENDGEEPDIELLITEGRVRAATLVSIPAFSETSRPLELITEDAELALIAAEEEGQDSGEARARLLALVASMSGGHETRPAVELFVRPALNGPTPITWDWENGRVFGHIATWQTCHVGYADVCVTAPRAAEGSYAWFNRYGVETSDGGLISAGRLTLGGQHAGLSLAANSAMAAYDGKTVAADVVAYEDEYGIVVSGAIRPGLSGTDRAILERRKVSGDWREIGGELALIEVLALSPGPRAHSEPGFPVETYSRGGRQVALTASLGPEPGVTYLTADRAPLVDTVALAAAVVDEQERREAARAARAELAATVEADEAGRAALARGELATLVQEG